MLSKTSFLLVLFPALLQGFTLDYTDRGPITSLKPPDLSADSLLGWSMAHYNQDIILGAPLESGTGIVNFDLCECLYVNLQIIYSTTLPVQVLKNCNSSCFL